MEKKKNVTISVDKRVLMQRINRRLLKENQALRASRGWREQSNLGDFYLLDLYKNAVIAFRMSKKEIEDMAREIGALKPYEEFPEDF